LGRIPTEYLPPREAWPERVYSLPELRHMVVLGTGKLLRHALRDSKS